jgi:hypothetical protein
MSDKLKEYERVSRSGGDQGRIYATGISRSEARAVVALHGQLDSNGRSQLLNMNVREAANIATTLVKK